MYELETLPAPELRRLVSDGASTVIVPFGSIEHQGKHLPVGADAMLADAVGREVARRLGAVLAPTVRVGCVEQHRQLAGSLSLGAQTLTEVALEQPRGDVGPRPGTHSGEWLTSVMLALRPELVDVARARPDLAAEVRRAESRRGADHLERFVASIVASLRAAEARH